jgi:hypothetical protein
MSASISALVRALALLALPAALGCSVGQGTGDVHSKGLFARDCWGVVSASPDQAVGACYSMAPDFFAANPFFNTLEITVQRGSDETEVSDGLGVLIDDVPTILSAITAASLGDAGTDGGVDAGSDAGTAGDLYGLSDGGATEPLSCDGTSTPTPGQPTSCDGVLPPPGKATFMVDLPAGVVPPGSPTTLPPDLAANPPIVHMSLYLNRTCHNQNITLYAVDGWIAFNALFDGNPDETQADQKLTDATFNVEFGDISDVPFGQYAGDVPPGLRSRICGSFKFYFERGQPAQPFP